VLNSAQGEREHHFVKENHFSRAAKQNFTATIGKQYLRLRGMALMERSRNPPASLPELGNSYKMSNDTGSETRIDLIEWFSEHPKDPALRVRDAISTTT
jgi:hypothetical protein